MVRKHSHATYLNTVVVSIKPLTFTINITAQKFLLSNTSTKRLQTFAIVCFEFASLVLVRKHS